MDTYEQGKKITVKAEAMKAEAKEHFGQCKELTAAISDFFGSPVIGPVVFWFLHRIVALFTVSFFLYTLVAERERAVRAFGTSSEAWGYDLCAGLFDAGTGGFAYADPLTAQFDQCAHGVGHGLYLARRTCGEYGPVGAGAARERWAAMCVNGWRMEHILWRTRRVGFAYPR